MLIRLDKVTYTYGLHSVYQTDAMKDVSFSIEEGEFIGIIGHTGSGKSTLIQHLNGLIRPTSGKVFYEDEDIWAENYPIRSLRSKVGLVFQYPEHQLFEDTIFHDVCFGPKNQGLDRETVKMRAEEALRQVGIPKEMYENSPFDLSGGQKRRVAIAGVLAMNPKVLVLDEPTAGLDPRGRDELFSVIEDLQKQRKITVILVSHSMEDVAKYVNRMMVMNQGKLVFDGKPREVFLHYKELEAMGLSAPQVTYILQALHKKGLNVDTSAIRLEEAKETILKALKERDNAT